MNSLAKGSMMAAGVLVAATAGVMVVLPGHAGLPAAAQTGHVPLQPRAGRAAWITSVTPGPPATVTMEMAWHYTGEAAVAYARAHHLHAPMNDHIDVDRKLSATVAVSPTIQASINPEAAGVQHLSPAAFLAWAGAHPAAKFNGQYAGPLYAVTFNNDVLVSANEIFEP